MGIRWATPLEKEAARISGAERLGKDRVFFPFALVETPTGREIMRGDGREPICTPDGEYVVSSNEEGVYQLWAVSPRHPFRHFLWLAATWSVFD